MSKNNGEYHVPPPKYVLYIDDSEDSTQARNAMSDAGLEFIVRYSATRRVPSVETGYGDYEGLQEILGYLIPDPGWEQKKVALDARFGLGKAR